MAEFHRRTALPPDDGRRQLFLHLPVEWHEVLTRLAERRSVSRGAAARLALHDWPPFQQELASLATQIAAGAWSPRPRGTKFTKPEKAANDE